MTQQESAIIYTQAMIEKGNNFKISEKKYTPLSRNVIRLEPEEKTAIPTDSKFNNVTVIAISNLLLKAADQQGFDANEVDLVKVQILGYTRMLYNDLEQTQTIVEFPKSVMSVIVTKEDKNGDSDSDYTAIQNKAKAALQTELTLKNGDKIRGVLRTTNGEDDPFDFYALHLRATCQSSVTDINDGILYQIPRDRKETITYSKDGTDTPQDIWGVLYIVDSDLDTASNPSLSATASIELSVVFLQTSS